MNKKGFLFLFLVLGGMVPSTVFGQGIFGVLNVGVELPISYTFKDADDGGSLSADGFPMGVIVSSRLPIFDLGVGFEYYQIKLDAPGTHGIAHTFVDLFWVSPIPATVNLALGGGYGISQVNGDNAGSFDTTASWQYYAKLGVPITEMFEIGVGYHNVNSQIKIKNSDSLLEAGGSLITVGFAASF